MRLSPKQHAFLNLAARIHGIEFSRSANATRTYLTRTGLIEMVPHSCDLYIATPKGRDVLRTIETGNIRFTG